MNTLPTQMAPAVVQNENAGYSPLEESNTTGYVRKPTKSILKLRENVTMPIYTELNDSAGGPARLPNRRVSFAEKVKLHKIDFVPVSQELEPYNSTQESDSDEDDTSFLKLEADADKIVSALSIRTPSYPSELSSDEDEDEEQTMELTGQIKQAPQMLMYSNELILPPPVSPQTQKSPSDLEGTPTKHTPLQLELPTELQEEDMELTETIPQLRDPENDEITMDITNIQAPPQNHDHEEEVTMDITRIHTIEVPKLDDIPEEGLEADHEVTMDTTKFFGSEHISSKPVLLSPDSKHTPIEIPEINLEDSDSDEDTPMELTQPMAINGALHLNIPNLLPPPEVLVTPQQEAKQQESAALENMEEQDMDFSISAPALSEEQLQPETEALPAYELSVSIDQITEIERPQSTDLTISSEKRMLQAFDQLIQAELAEHPELSQPMELTQENVDSHIDSYPSIKKRKLDTAVDLPSPQSPRFEAQGTTTTIPLADVSMASWDGEQDYSTMPPVSLTDFLTDIGVKFYDDLEIATNMTSRYSLSLPETKERYSDVEYYRANINLPLLEVHELSCKELAGKIQQGKKLFQELKDKTFQDNPDLFKQYYRSSYYDQATMKSRFHLLKEYTRQQAKQIWYDWRTKLMQNILDVLQSNLEILQADKGILLEHIATLDASYRDIQAQLYLLRTDVLQFREIKSQFQDLDADQIKSIKTKLSELNSLLLEHKEKIVQKEAELASIQAAIEDRNSEIGGLAEEVKDAEAKLNKTKHFNTGEIEVLDARSKILQAVAGLKFLKSGENKCKEFAFNERVKVEVDFLKSSAEAIKYLLASADSKILHNADLIEKFALQLVDNSIADVNENFALFKNNWLKFARLDEDIYKLSLKYPIVFIDKKDHISFKVSYFSFTDSLKVNYFVDVALADLQYYPNKVSVSAEVLRQKDSHSLKSQIASKSNIFAHLHEITIRE